MSDSSSLLARALVPLGVIILLAVGAAIGLFFWQSQKPVSQKPLSYLPTPNDVKPAVQVAPVAAVKPADIPLPEPEAPAASPPTERARRADVFGDANALWSGLQASLAPKLTALLLPDEFTRKFTILVYGLSEGRLVAQNRPYVSPEGVFAVAKFSDGPEALYRMLPHNTARYDAYLEALRWANSDAGLVLYERSYPQLQAAFEELGIGNRSFHQVAIMAIDNLLAAPDGNGDFTLQQPKARYTYSDAELEKLPATHKLMLRMGAVHNQAVKQQLRQLRQRLVEFTP